MPVLHGGLCLQIILIQIAKFRKGIADAAVITVFPKQGNDFDIEVIFRNKYIVYCRHNIILIFDCINSGGFPIQHLGHELVHIDDIRDTMQHEKMFFVLRFPSISIHGIGKL